MDFSAAIMLYKPLHIHCKQYSNCSESRERIDKDFMQNVV